ncbi:restriction endonuclease [Massilia eburnea]|nr:restriction endonuclease [Massilia eburnea]
MTALEDAGLLVLRNRSYSGDGGVDGVVWNPRIGWLAVQVKRYSTHICRGHLLDFGDAIQRKNFNGGLFVHTG